MIRYGDGHLGPVSIIVDADILDVGEVIEMNSKFLGAEGSLLSAQVFMSVVAKWLCVDIEVQSLLFSC